MTNHMKRRRMALVIVGISVLAVVCCIAYLQSPRSVVIAIIDTGVTPSQSGPQVPGWNFFDDSADTSDQDGHGTKVARLASEACPKCSILPIKIARHAAGVRPGDLASAIRFAIGHDARVLTISFGLSTESPELRQAVREAAASKRIVVTAAGADPANPFRSSELSKVFPQAYREVLVIGTAVSMSRPQLAQNAGGQLDLVMLEAPDTESSSFAAARISGWAGDLLRHHRSYGPARIRRLLRAHTKAPDLPDTDRFGFGVFLPGTKLVGTGARPDFRVYKTAKDYVVDFNADRDIVAVGSAWHCPKDVHADLQTRMLPVLNGKGRAQLRLAPPPNGKCHAKVHVRFAPEEGRSTGRESEFEIPLDVTP